MKDIEAIKALLEKLHSKVAVGLTIISNSKQKYKDIVADWKIPTIYMEWNEYFISAALRQHGVSVIPISKNPFTLAKSSNRIETSLVHGLQVVADSIPSYVKYSKFIYLDNWEQSLFALADGSAMKKPDNNNYFSRQNNDIVIEWCRVLGS